MSRRILVAAACAAATLVATPLAATALDAYYDSATPEARGWENDSGLQADPAGEQQGQREQGVRTLIFRTLESPDVNSHPQNCPFAGANLFLGAHIYSMTTRESDSEVMNETVQEIGLASACGLITAPLIPGTLVPFYVEFTLDNGPSRGDTYTAVGTCQVISNNVPTRGVVLAGCALRVIQGPPGFTGGAATSMSIFNPRRLPGAGTGSFWTLRAYFA